MPLSGSGHFSWGASCHHACTACRLRGCRTGTIDCMFCKSEVFGTLAEESDVKQAVIDAKQAEVDAQREEIERLRKELSRKVL